eukprot:1602502-Amphidinium_carterae.1
MARGGIVWAMPPSPQRSNCLACKHLLRLALWHRHTIPVCEGDCGKLAKLSPVAGLEYLSNTMTFVFQSSQTDWNRPFNFGSVQVSMGTLGKLTFQAGVG